MYELSSSFGADCAGWVSMRSASSFFFMNSSVAFCASAAASALCAGVTGDDPGARIVGAVGCGAGCAYALCCTGADSGFAVCITGGIITGASTVSRSTGTWVSGVSAGCGAGRTSACTGGV